MNEDILSCEFNINRSSLSRSHEDPTQRSFMTNFYHQIIMKLSAIMESLQTDSRKVEQKHKREVAALHSKIHLRELQIYRLLKINRQIDNGTHLSRTKLKQDRRTAIQSDLAQHSIIVNTSEMLDQLKIAVDMVRRDSEQELSRAMKVRQSDNQTVQNETNHFKKQQQPISQRFVFQQNAYQDKNQNSTTYTASATKCNLHTWQAHHFENNPLLQSTKEDILQLFGKNKSEERSLSVIQHYKKDSNLMSYSLSSNQTKYATMEATSNINKQTQVQQLDHNLQNRFYQRFQKKKRSNTKKSGIEGYSAKRLHYSLDYGIIQKIKQNKVNNYTYLNNKTMKNEQQNKVNELNSAVKESKASLYNFSGKRYPFPREFKDQNYHFTNSAGQGHYHRERGKQERTNKQQHQHWHNIRQSISNSCHSPNSNHNKDDCYNIKFNTNKKLKYKVKAPKLSKPEQYISTSVKEQYKDQPSNQHHRSAQCFKYELNNSAHAQNYLTKFQDLEQSDPLKLKCPCNLNDHSLEVYKRQQPKSNLLKQKLQDDCTRNTKDGNCSQSQRVCKMGVLPEIQNRAALELNYIKRPVNQIPQGLRKLVTVSYPRNP